MFGLSEGAVCVESRILHVITRSRAMRLRSLLKVLRPIYGTVLELWNRVVGHVLTMVALPNGIRLHGPQEDLSQRANFDGHGALEDGAKYQGDRSTNQPNHKRIIQPHQPDLISPHSTASSSWPRDHVPLSVLALRCSRQTDGFGVAYRSHGQLSESWITISTFEICRRSSLSVRKKAYSVLGCCCCCADDVALDVGADGNS